MKTEILQWHPAFYAAAQIEFGDELEKLYFENEHQLSKKPLLIDVLIIKLRCGDRIHKNIGKIFREHNIIEYKSPEDYLSINDYYKVLGYACFYQSDTEKVCQILPEEITITFVCTHFPQKLINYLSGQNGFFIDHAEAGIYYINGGIFPIQIIVIDRLSSENNVWMSRLRKDLTIADDIDQLARKYRQKRNSPLYSAVMDVIMKANHEVVEEAKNMCDAIRELFADELEEGVKRGVQLGKEQGIQALILDNLEEQKTKEQIIAKLVKRFELSPDIAETYYNRYGNITAL
ncbi:3-isopropylmalate dehydrogenase [Clostridium sp. chh4-2]|uniref:3-isopropylmalate dehydrogenase n=1 Tax=Clostridium sp. chh4-2 TaxID=2067550 RepID=UPI000CCEA61B|nr:3-isopropylmalate dehydrogenase [Clostridium sp. chh4-2]PNV59025.1 3-isopropylmalate dehydrogenase [Clostridium sp. chh4-2]